jgi:hypothetical protein
MALSEINKDILTHILGKNVPIENNLPTLEEPIKNINEDVLKYTSSYLNAFNKLMELQLKDLESEMENIKNVIECHLDLPI